MNEMKSLTLNGKTYDSFTDKNAAKTSAGKVGQTMVVKAVDENGKPTEWECVDLPSGNVDQEQITAAVNEALAEAKASGEFDGKDGYTPQKGIDYFDGKDGIDGVDGKDGYTPQKGIDYFDGQDGQDGVSATHSWNGTVLTVTSASGTSSADLKGAKGDTGAQGVQGEKGEKGDKGDTGATGSAGKTPVKGTDYFTEADKTEMVEDVLAEIAGNEPLIDNIAEVVKAEVPLVKSAEQPTFVDSIDKMTDPTKVYVMPDGYLYGYREVENYNLLKLSEVEASKRLQDSTTELTSSTSNHTTGWIPVEYGKYYSGSALFEDGARHAYDTSYWFSITRWNVKYKDGTEVAMGKTVPWVSGYTNKVFAITSEDIVAIRIQFNFTARTSGSNAVLSTSTIDDIRAYKPMLVNGNTADEAYSNALNLEYIDGDVGAIAEWYDTGLAYNQPADYEARIVELESKVSELEEQVEELQNSEKNEIYGKTVLNFGDSIAEGGANNNRNYCTIIGEKYNMPVISVAVGGAIMARDTSLGATRYILEQIETAITNHGSTKFDFIMLEGGTNDLQYLAAGTEQMGVMTDAYDGNYDETTVIGALEKALYLIRTTWLSSNIIFVIPHHMSSRDYALQKQLWSEYVAVCKKWGIPVANVYEEGQYNTHIASMNALYAKESSTTDTGYDRTHPNEDGYRKWYCPLIVSKMKEIIFE